MSSLKTDFKQIAEDIRNPENRPQKDKNQTKSDNVLTPCIDLPEAELRCGQPPYFFQRSRRRPKEKPGKDDIDQETRQLPESDKPVRGNELSECLDDDQADKAANDGRRDEQTLENGKARPDDDSQYEKHTDGAKGHDGDH